MKVECIDLGVVDYKDSWGLQKEFLPRLRDGSLDAVFISCRHRPVITLGRAAGPASIVAPAEELLRRGIPVYAVERGGDATYHGPGQATVYPLCNLGRFKKDIHLFLRMLEDAVIAFTAGMGGEAARRPGLTGAWCGRRKLASIGIAIKNWITFHGVSVNIATGDLGNFRLIRPGGMDIEMIALEEVCRRPIDADDARLRLVSTIREVFCG